jgi:hypothetical protein
MFYLELTTKSIFLDLGEGTGRRQIVMASMNRALHVRQWKSQRVTIM